MLRHSFTTEYGRIDVELSASGGEAYFAAQDYLAPIDAAGQFADWFGRAFRLTPPQTYVKTPAWTLSVVRPQTLCIDIA